VKEGLEINLFGLVYGINPLKLSLKLPCIGEITFLTRPFFKSIFSLKDNLDFHLSPCGEVDAAGGG